MRRTEYACPFATNRARLANAVDALKRYLVEHPDGGILVEFISGKALGITALDRIRDQAVRERDATAVVIIDYLKQMPSDKWPKILEHVK